MNCPVCLKQKTMQEIHDAYDVELDNTLCNEHFLELGLLLKTKYVGGIK
jgi:hypothetical protein